MNLKNSNNTDMSFYVKKLDNYIGRLHYSLYNRKTYQDCSIMNLWVVDFLYHQDDDIYQKDIENEFFVNRATASKMLKLMEEKHLIKRVPSSYDARLKKIVLEEKGIELQKMAMEIRQDVEKKLTDPLTEEEVKIFKSLCIKIIEGLS